MIVYHGTTYNIWKKVINSGYIAKATKDNSPYSKCGSLATDYGYVYLVENPIEAIEYASWAWSAVNEGGHLSRRFLIVIKVDVPEEELETDSVDDLRRPMTYQKGPYFRIRRNIMFSEIIGIAPFQYSNFESSCQDIDRMIDNSVSSLVNWCEPTATPTDWNGASHLL